MKGFRTGGVNFITLVGWVVRLGGEWSGGGGGVSGVLVRDVVGGGGRLGGGVGECVLSGW